MLTLPFLTKSLKVSAINDIQISMTNSSQNKLAPNEPKIQTISCSNHKAIESPSTTTPLATGCSQTMLSLHVFIGELVYSVSFP